MSLRLRAILLAMIVVLALYLNGSQIVQHWSIESDARAALRIDEGWEGVYSTGKQVSGLIFFDEGLSEYSFAIYAKNPFRAGWFFQSGGCTQMESLGVVSYSNAERNEMAYLSMNQQRISRIVLEGSSSTETIKVDPARPLALVLSSELTATFYNAKGECIEVMESGF